MSTTTFTVHQAIEALSERCDGAQTRDRQGFSAVHTHMGRYLGQLPIEEWPEGTEYFVYKHVLHVYTNQLAAYGIPIEMIQAPETPQQEYDGVGSLNDSLRKKIRKKAKKIQNPTHQGNGNGEPELSEEKIQNPTHQGNGNGEPELSEEEKRAIWLENNFINLEDTSNNGKLLAIYFDYDPEMVREIKEIRGARFNGDGHKHWNVPLYGREEVIAFGERHGLDISQEARDVVAPESDYIVWEEDHIQVFFAFDYAMLNDIKEMIPRGSRKFVKTAPKHWRVEMNEGGLKGLMEFCREYPVFGQNLPRLKELHDAICAAGDEKAAFSKAVRSDAIWPELEETFQALKGTLRPFQKIGVQHILENKRVLIADDMGVGKTLESLAFLHSSHVLHGQGHEKVVVDSLPAVVVCPASVKYNWAKEMRSWLPDDLSVSIVASKKRPITLILKDGSEASIPLNDYSADVIIVNYDILKRNLPKLLARKNNTIILDECFPFETLILTEQGQIPIGEIVEKKLDVKVLSWDKETKVLLYKRINRWVKNKSKESIVRVHHEKGSFTCTANHRIYTSNRGYVRADSLRDSDLLQRVSDPVLDEAKREEYSQILQPKMCPDSLVERSVTAREAQGAEGKLLSLPQSDEKVRIVWQRIPSSKMQREVCTTLFRGDEKCQENVPTIAPKLRDRHCPSDIQNSHRGRRPQSPNETCGKERQAKGLHTQTSRVVRIEVLKQRSASRSEGCCSENPWTYNIEVEDNHNYVASNILVSNCHNIKEKKSQRSAAALELGSDVEYRVELSGTPILNRPIELVSQLDFLNRLNSDFGGFWEYVSRFCDAERTPWGWDFDGAANMDELHEILRRSGIYLRRSKEQVLPELPGKQRTTVPLEMDPKVRKEYYEALTGFIEWLHGNAKVDKEYRKKIKTLPDDKREEAIAAYRAVKAERAKSNEHLVRIGVLQQLAAKAKLKSLIRWVEDFLATGEKLVLFGIHLDPINEIAKHFGAPTITGDTDTLERQRIVDRFQTDPDCKLVVCNIKAAGVGITLTASSNVAFFELYWNNALHNQAEDRCLRLGQQNAVNCWYLVARNTIEDEVARLIESKRAVTGAIIDGDGSQIDDKETIGNLTKFLIAEASAQNKRLAKMATDMEGVLY